jgi:hypothetical protein
MPKTTSEIIDEWATTNDIGWNWIASREAWVPVQDTAMKYQMDDRRKNSPKEWEDSASRFIEAIQSSDRWCLDPDETEWLNGAKPVTFPWPLPWEGKRRAG